MTPPSARRWALYSAVLAPIALIGGWTLAAAVQPDGFDSVAQTISKLAAIGAPHRGIMTSGLLLLGLAHMLTAAGLRPARPAGRVLLAVGGLGSIAVALFPQPAVGSSLGHTASATVAFVTLAVWPALAARRSAPRVLRLPVCLVATVLLVLLLTLFEFTIALPVVGLTERLLAGAQAVWPLVVVLGALRPPAVVRP